jgi:hypothetical protein
MAQHTLSPDTLSTLRRQLAPLPPRSAARRQRIQAAAAFYGVSEPTLYRLLRQRPHPHALGRADRGIPRVLPKAELERYLELIAALQVRTSNGKGRHLSTREAIRLLEDYGVDTPAGHVQAPKGLLKKPTVNAYLKAWGLDWRTVRREPPAVRFQAQYSNELWQFDIRPTVSPLINPLLYCHINGFQRASRVGKPWPGGENRMDGWAAHPVAW